MTNSQSKIIDTVATTCKEFQHPWTDKCVNATCGLMLASTPYCLRVYTVVYALSLLMRGRVPTLIDIKRTFFGILQSTAFLVTNSYTFIMFNCLFRNLFGRYYHATVAFLPCFFSSLMALSVERAARRPMLTLYVANVATETLWHMAEARGLVRSIPHGQTLIFGVSVSILLYIYRLGLHKTSCKDSIYNILKMFVGKTEEGPIAKLNPGVRRSRPPLNFTTVSGLVQVYLRFIEAIKSKHETCKHSMPCLNYAIFGGLRPFFGGVALQVALKLVMNIKKLVQMKMEWRKTVFNKNTLNLGIFLGSFSLLYKSVSCILRHSFGFDDPIFAIPAGLIGSIAFTQYPDVTVSLYVMWKMLQIVYNLGIEKGIVPRVPGFIFLLYATCTATLFHSGILEPKTLRPSYLKFLQAISGDRLSKFNLTPFDVYGNNASQNSKEVMEKLKIFNHSPLPKFALASGI